MNTEELKIIESAVAVLDNIPILKGKYKYELITGENIQIKLHVNNNVLIYSVFARNELRAEQLPRVQSATGKGNTLVLANHIHSNLREQLVTNNIPYIDCNGNVYLYEENLYILINTNKKNDNIKILPGRAFTKTGLKVVFNFLLNERLLDMSYRHISEDTGVSLGNITNIINALKVQNFVVEETRGGLKLANKKQLVERWVTYYEHTLKPSVELGTYRFENEEELKNWRRIPLDTKTTVWGGEPAANLLTGSIKPERLTIYTDEYPNELMKHYRLVKDPEGYITVCARFWKYNRYRNAHIAPSLLVYADMLCSGKLKNIELAEKIFDDVLKADLQM